MNRLLTLFCTLLLLVLGRTATATAPYHVYEQNPETTERNELRVTSVEDFLALTPKEIEARTGEKPSLGERIALKLAQKRVKKQLKKGKQPEFQEGGSGGKLGLLSLIFGGAGVLLVFLPIIGLLGLLSGIAGFVLGLIALKRGEKKTMPIIGMVLGGLVILLFIVAIAVVASYF